MSRQTELVATIGDITQADTDAIVNAANTELWMGSGVAGAIKRAGGEAVEREAVNKGPIDLGGAVATTAGDLPHRRVIHAAAMGYQSGDMIPASTESVRQATEMSLQVADQERLTSIAFPALGTGVGGFGIEECAEVMVSAAAGYLDHSQTGIQRVVFVLRDENARQAFADVIARHEG